MNEAFLQSTVLVTCEVDATHLTSRSGSFVSRPLSADKGHVILVTNRHVLPPPGFQRSIRIRVSVKTEGKSAVRFIRLKSVGQS